MFTGLIQQKGRIVSMYKTSEKGRIEVATEFDLLSRGESIAVDGVCLTVVEFRKGNFIADISKETLLQTTLGMLQPGDEVNLERALKFNQRFGGHFVTGHIDGIGIIKHKKESISGVELDIQVPEKLKNMIVPKGSIAIDGISLTINQVQDERCTIMLVPYTIALTTLAKKSKGSFVNIEVDIIAKYIKQILEHKKGEDSKLTLDFLRDMGF
jgi:riboflavin synthase